MLVDFASSLAFFPDLDMLYLWKQWGQVLIGNGGPWVQTLPEWGRQRWVVVPHCQGGLLLLVAGGGSGSQPPT